MKENNIGDTLIIQPHKKKIMISVARARVSLKQKSIICNKGYIYIFYKYYTVLYMLCLLTGKIDNEALCCIKLPYDLC